MAVTRTCDICRRPTNRIVAKLNYIPVVGNKAKERTHSHYTHHLDVGECCGTKILSTFNFRERMTKEQYNKVRSGS
jgi:hypothetical protein